MVRLKRTLQGYWPTRLVLLALVAALAGCASTGAGAPTREACAKDPFEGFNRAMFSINDGVDKVFLKPIAQGYDAVVPLPAKVGFGNFRDNLWEISRGTNAFLQGKPEEGFTGFVRLLVNSTVGIFGFFDVSTELGMEEGDEDLGQTLAVWGVGHGPYLFMPLLGPSSVRDLPAGAVEQYFYPMMWAVDDIPVRNSLMAWRIIDARAALLPADRLVNEAALDRYSYIRAAYFQRRRSQIYDGYPPPLDDDSVCN